VVDAPDGSALREAAPLGYNPFLPEVHADPYPMYAQLRERSPVLQSFPGLWVLSRYRDIAPLFRDPRMSADRRNSSLYQAFIASLPDQHWIEEIPPSMLFLDPPDHTRLRKLANRAFTPRVVEAMRPRVEELVADLLDAAASDGHLDVVGDLGYPLPVTVICDMLAIPEADREQVRAWSLDLIYTLDPIVPQDKLERAERAAYAFRDYVQDLIVERRPRPGDDLLSRLIASEESGERLTDEDIVSTCVLLLIAGHETTSGLIGNGMLALLRHPDQMRRLREDPSLIRTAVEELLRYDGPVQLTGRIARERLEVGGQEIQAGENVVFLSGSANHDPEVFPGPDRLDIGREPNHHLGFGGGIHFCLGAPLARLEAGIAIGALVRRFRDIELAADDVEWRDTITLRALRALPVTC
jgi:cytochrome P450